MTEDKTLFLKKITGDDAKKTKRLPETQVLTKDFASCKIGYKPQRKRKQRNWVNQISFLSYDILQNLQLAETISPSVIYIQIFLWQLPLFYFTFLNH